MALALRSSPKKEPPRYEMTPIRQKDINEDNNKVAELVLKAAQEGYSSLTIADYYSLTRIPEEIGQLKKLWKLVVSSNFGLEDLPDSIGYLDEHLSHLDASYNSLCRVPATIYGLRFLQVLDLSNNKLHYLPPGIDRLYSLEELSVANNYITAFPTEVTYLGKLKNLLAYNNPLIGEEDDAYEPYVPPDLELCSLCKCPFDDPQSMITLVNFVDVAGNKSLPVNYFTCGERCERIVKEIMDSEMAKYSQLVYDEDSDG